MDFKSKNIFSWRLCCLALQIAKKQFLRLQFSDLNARYLSRLTSVFLLSALLLSSHNSFAGEDLSIESEIRLIEELEGETDLVDFRRRLNEVKSDLITGRLEEPSIATKEIRNLEYEIRRLISGAESSQITSSAKNKLAVFAMDDPDKTSAADDISFVLSKALLFSATVPSYSIVNYQQGASNDFSGLSYYDKIDKIIDGRGFLLSIWGRIAIEGDGYQLTFHGQLPDSGSGVQHIVSDPNRFGIYPLVASVAQRRFLIRSLKLSARDLEQLAVAANEIRKLRADPDEGSDIVTTIPTDRVHYVIDSQDDWIKLAIDGGGTGWTSVSAFCVEACKSVLDVAHFSNALVSESVGFSAKLDNNSVAPQAQVAINQLRAIQALSLSPQRAIEIADRFERENGFANIAAVAEVLQNIQYGTLTEKKTRFITQNLAIAATKWPTNVEMLANLAAMFQSLQDFDRRDIALEIVASLRGNTMPQVTAPELTIAFVDNSRIISMQKVAETYTAYTGTKLNWVLLEEGVLREQVTSDVATGGGEYDIISIGMQEAPIWGAAGWIEPLDFGDAYDIDDLLPAMRSGLSHEGTLYAAPFYGEDSP